MGSIIIHAFGFISDILEFVFFFINVEKVYNAMLVSNSALDDYFSKALDLFII